MHGTLISNRHAGLTGRQRDVLQLITQGLSNKEIARTLNIAPGTVKIHVAALFGKFGVRRRSAVAVAGAQFFATSATILQFPNGEKLALSAAARRGPCRSRLPQRSRRANCSAGPPVRFAMAHLYAANEFLSLAIEVTEQARI